MRASLAAPPAPSSEHCLANCGSTYLGSVAARLTQVSPKGDSWVECRVLQRIQEKISETRYAQLVLLISKLRAWARCFLCDLPQIERMFAGSCMRGSFASASPQALCSVGYQLPDRNRTLPAAASLTKKPCSAKMPRGSAKLTVADPSHRTCGCEV